jgi:hypothetical protein
MGATREILATAGSFRMLAPPASVWVIHAYADRSRPFHADYGGKDTCVVLPVKVLKAGQESYWLHQIAKNREEHFSGKGKSPGRFVGEVTASSFVPPTQPVAAVGRSDDVVTLQ